MSVEKLLEQPHTPPSRVKRREKVLPGEVHTHSQLQSDPPSATTSRRRRLLQSHHLRGCWCSGRIPGLLPDGAGHHQEAALLNTQPDPPQPPPPALPSRWCRNLSKHQELLQHVLVFIHSALKGAFQGSRVAPAAASLEDVRYQNVKQVFSAEHGCKNASYQTVVVDY